MVKHFEQYHIHWISLDPTIGSEISKTRPCVIVSPNEMNEFLKTIIVIPITSTIKTYPWRVECVVSGRNGSIATDQIKAVDRIRIGAKIEELSKKEIASLKECMKTMLIE